MFSVCSNTVVMWSEKHKKDGSRGMLISARHVFGSAKDQVLLGGFRIMKYGGSKTPTGRKV